ncbi:MAG: ribonuclease HII [Oligoflexia bacterium]|nr:ribonuclease HII [Oligoflexia bacterium]
MRERYILGIDEAGRGPVLGPMVVCGMLWDNNAVLSPEAMGVRDSKKLNGKKREELFHLIVDETEWFSVSVVWPEVIDRYVEVNALNRLEAEVMASIISAVPADTGIFVDSPQEPRVFTEMIAGNLDSDYCINCMFKADQLVPAVSAASIVAKVVRDSIMDELKVYFGDFGSGYPSDPKTISFLKRPEPPSFLVRRSWRTYRNIYNNGDFFGEQNY